MLRSYKYRLLPTLEQSVLLDKHIGATRFVYNLALETKNYAYSTHRKNVSVFELMRQLTDLKKECVWLKEIDSQCLQQSLINLDKAFTGFFKGHAKFPNFKSKSRSIQSFRNPHGKCVKIIADKIKFPKFTEGVKIVLHRNFEGKIRSSTVSKTPTGKYFISMLIDTQKESKSPVKIKSTTTVGIDLGLKDFIVTSAGDKVNNPKFLQKQMLRLKFLHRQHSKKKKGGKNRVKSKLKIALCHEKVVNQRKDFLHKLSTKLVSENQTLCFENLNMTGMMKNHNIAGAISSVGWGQFVEMCKYKSEWSGKNLLQIPTFEPSTKICSSCGYSNSNLTLKDREWDCICGAHHDRDVNAAVNIKNYCLNKISGEAHRKKSVELPTMAGAMKQKGKLTKCRQSNQEDK
jgi:putative transposase